MKSITYLAVFEQGDEGSCSVSFPDIPGCFSFGATITEAKKRAEEALNLHIYGMERDGEALPEPSGRFPKELTEGNLIVPITVFPGLYRMKRENERVKTNITIPLWLKRLAEERQVNYSRLLENALLEYLQVSPNFE